jgi:O-antigen/teichoic acid export membrane protein
LSRAWAEPDDAFAKLIERSLRTTGWLTVGGGMLWVLLAPTIATFAYGTAFAPAGVPLQCLAGICILAAVHGHFRFGMIAAGQQRFATLSTGIGTAVALGSIPWAYRENGLTGAALALVVAEAVVLVACYAFGVRQLRLDRPLRALLRPMLIGGPVVAAVALLPSGTPVSGRVAIFVVGLGLAAWFGEPDLQETWRRLRERTPEEPPR